MYTVKNYMIRTTAKFKACKRPKRNPDYQSPSGSRYWYGENNKGAYVIREADHWSSINFKKEKISVVQCARVARCHWTLTEFKPIYMFAYSTFSSVFKKGGESGDLGAPYLTKQVCGKAYFKDFKPNNK